MLIPFGLIKFLSHKIGGSITQNWICRISTETLSWKGFYSERDLMTWQNMYMSPVQILPFFYHIILPCCTPAVLYSCTPVLLYFCTPAPLYPQLPPYPVWQWPLSYESPIYAYIFPKLLYPLNNIALSCSINTTVGIAYERLGGETFRKGCFWWRWWCIEGSTFDSRGPW